MFNGTKYNINTFRILLQENLMAFHNKAQVWKAKLQSFPEPSKVSHKMYCANNIQASDLIYNVLSVHERENECKVEITFQLESSFQKYLEQKLFYKNHNSK